MSPQARQIASGTAKAPPPPTGGEQRLTQAAVAYRPVIGGGVNIPKTVETDTGTTVTEDGSAGCALLKARPAA